MTDYDSLQVFNIQKYSLHDGGGIRTMVFLKGCPLRCRWCCNPESQKSVPEIMFRKTRCIGREECGLCEKAAPEGGIVFGEDNKPKLDFEICNRNTDWIEICPAKALVLEGKRMPVDEIMRIVLSDSVFYRKKGGLTVSGGEPLIQDGAVHLLQRAKEERIHTAAETCGFVPEEKLLAAAEYLDEIFFDVKSADAVKHEEYTGVSNERILSNLRALKKNYPEKKIHVRTPVIPGFNDTKEELERIGEVLKKTGINDWEKLPYHTYGVGKYEMLGREYLLK